MRMFWRMAAVGWVVEWVGGRRMNAWLVMLGEMKSTKCSSAGEGLHSGARDRGRDGMGDGGFLLLPAGESNETKQPTRCGRTDGLPTAAAQTPHTTPEEQGSRVPATMGEAQAGDFHDGLAGSASSDWPARLPGTRGGLITKDERSSVSLSGPLCPLVSVPLPSHSRCPLPASPPPKDPNHPCPGRSQAMFGTVAAVQPSVRLHPTPPLFWALDPDDTSNTPHTKHLQQLGSAGMLVGALARFRWQQ